MYEVTINGEKIGYITDSKEVEDYINEKTNNNEETIAFVDIEYMPEIKLSLVTRSQQDALDEVIEKIDSNISIEYTTYAITYNGENKTYVATMEEAEKVVEDIKEKYSTTYTKKLGILQVYSNNIEEIEALDVTEATTKVSTVLNKVKTTNTVKVAKANSSSSINGVNFTVKPISGTITSRFGSRSSPGGIGSTNHKGLDISAKSGTAIKAAASGTVTFAGYKGSLGYLVIINNGNSVETYYGHCSKLYVSKGQKVSAGDTIAAVGQTGAATGPHLHFEVHINGTAVNPQKYLYK